MGPKPEVQGSRWP